MRCIVGQCFNCICIWSLGIFALKVQRESETQGLQSLLNRSSIAISKADNATREARESFLLGRNRSLADEHNHSTWLSRFFRVEGEIWEHALLPFVPHRHITSESGLQHLSSNSAGDGISTKVLVLLCVVLFVFTLVMYFADALGEGQDAPSKLPELLQVIDGCEGTWAHTYRNAEEGGKQRLALDLLYLCGIITPYEFAHVQVSRGHIDECIWIATVMLRQKPIDEWLKDKEGARKTFEMSVTQCFQARTDERAMKEYSSPQVADRMRSGNSSTLSPELDSRSDKKGSSKRQLLREEKEPLLKRCREIMASTRRPPKQPTHASNTASPSAEDPGGLAAVQKSAQHENPE
jgi:hypothetical protein